ncbi:MAG: hypothetical protein A3C58_00005 [Candidatus Staskawiczbacteria bacterium RIFCSPHIGHO2_02_FULL_34_10]|uniref:Uncharacterized protein n=2 Tax=Candidatus Staskawicziibacteriota TaxID=1817916 RepID=A0A1G2HLQ3_9BACT|nr:MAG: hypothetical protein A2639_03330 [Candidatus Staskawiczbacteria bacterium RIFCSPHIGHO2_01_FULL_34_27]OGZ66614.1 MAG: hypothetical protein A3C58_00005 [Candidatus Staskawiczbacteria bacterium RIFCSPHIGHO2_02_FULL_34_10]
MRIELVLVGQREFQRRLALMSKKRREVYRAELQALLENPHKIAKDVQLILDVMSQGALLSPEIRDRLIHSPFCRKNL